ncbi:response regulator [Pseudanabaena sp. ABRG5-3]|uniref:response regulator n=1 Tax=Pseudanabaena sp. ABRG5-3 TaxID=685565 RepID=UPI000DC6F882|nr:response regulator [Pseudanabaena sp. ABRG5-3]BBC26357.1 two-component hybrid sensor and regulator [Pseudanabaena sp. ABRG5-3]
MDTLGNLDQSTSNQTPDCNISADLSNSSSSFVHTPLSILLAEDNLVNQKVALRVLKHLGYEADVVGNGQEVIKAIANKSYDLILMDIQMPEMDGIEATQYIRNQELESQMSPIAIVAITANATHDDQYVCRKAGMNDYISKPIQIDKLRSVLQQYEALKNSQ